MGSKVCKTCGEEKSLDEFYYHVTARGQRENSCKECRRTYYRTVANPRKNPRGNGISKIAYSLVGGAKAFYQLPKQKRRDIRRSAALIFETQADAKVIYNTLDEQFNQTHPGGFVYLIVNDVWPGWVKVGMTTDVQRRLNDYQTSSPYRDYRLLDFVQVDDRKKAEARFHKTFSKLGERRGEWFQVPWTTAVVKLNESA